MVMLYIPLIWGHMPVPPEIRAFFGDQRFNVTPSPSVITDGCASPSNPGMNPWNYWMPTEQPPLSPELKIPSFYFWIEATFAISAPSKYNFA